MTLGDRVRFASAVTADGYDLRHCWRASADPAGRPAGEGEGGGTGAGSGSAGNPGDDPSASPPADEGEPDPLTEDEIKVPRIQQLSQEAAKHRHKAKTEKERADAAELRVKELEDQTTTETLLGQLRDAKAQNAFIVAATGKVGDVDAAWKLADKAEVKVNEDGTVEGIDAVLTKVLEKHPYLLPKPAEEIDPALVDRFPALSPSGRPNNGKRGGTDSVDYEVLARKFPALRNRGKP